MVHFFLWNYICEFEMHCRTIYRRNEKKSQFYGLHLNFKFVEVILDQFLWISVIRIIVGQFLWISVGFEKNQNFFFKIRMSSLPTLRAEHHPFVSCLVTQGPTCECIGVGGPTYFQISQKHPKLNGMWHVLSCILGCHAIVFNKYIMFQEIL